MRQFGKRIVMFLLAFCLTLGVGPVTAGATVSRSSEFFSAYSANVTGKSGGKICVTVSVKARSEMDVLGVNSVTIYESKDNSSFYPVATYRAADYPEMLGSGVLFSKTVVTYSGTIGYYYQAKVAVYAENDTGCESRGIMTSAKRAFQ